MDSCMIRMSVIVFILIAISLSYDSCRYVYCRLLLLSFFVLLPWVSIIATTCAHWKTVLHLRLQTVNMPKARPESPLRRTSESPETYFRPHLRKHKKHREALNREAPKP